ncbi:TlpA disulfide reductase family protein [uncultured Alistipes sp.]|jgi:thiol-disulfide isomerase/thioredoxin|uniref:TlpA disulfide reductase family protein n=1 Tax=uncultured Alistipes sp. TaxID=538949 RepID=UPI0025E09D01|nr:TlpA disulfide reductase family protein [uncultured Alistipes sp.]
MKKVFLYAISAAVLCSCTSQPKYVVEGDIAGLEGTVYMFQKDSLIDSAAVNAGKFRFEGKIAAPGARYLIDSREGRPQSFGMQLILEPGTIKITSDTEEANVRHVTGTPSNDASEAYSAASRALIKEYRAPETTDERREAIQEEFDALGRATVEANRDNFFGVTLLPSLAYELSGQELLDEIAKFSPEMQKTKEMTDMKTMAEQKIKTDVGQPYINIIQSDANGEIITLTSVIENPANKYTLIDFWASWCGPCMAEVPHLKQTYDKYHKLGFEIYGVSFDNNRDKWLGAIEQHGLNWIHVSDLNRFDNIAAKDYAVQGIPSNFLIDSEGKIVAKNLRGEDLYKKVEELLGK